MLDSRDPAEFEGVSDANLGHALHEAANKAQDALSDDELAARPWFKVVTVEIQIGNPHITAYKVGISSGGGG